MYSVTKEMWTETAHRLPDHPGRCRFIHGHSYRWQVTLESIDVNPDGMIIDFARLKEAMSEVIDPFDHALVLQKLIGAKTTVEQEVLETLRVFGIAERVIWVPYRPTAENMAQNVCQALKKTFPQYRIIVRVHETATSWAQYAE